MLLLRTDTLVIGHIANKSIQKVAMDGAFSSDDVQGSLSVIVSQIDTFIEDSKHAIRVLDEIGKIHPFVQSKLEIHSLGSRSYLS